MCLAHVSAGKQARTGDANQSMQLCPAAWTSHVCPVPVLLSCAVLCCVFGLFISFLLFLANPNGNFKFRHPLLVPPVSAHALIRSDSRLRACRAKSATSSMAYKLYHQLNNAAVTVLCITNCDIAIYYSRKDHTVSQETAWVELVPSESPLESGCLLSQPRLKSSLIPARHIQVYGILLVVVLFHLPCIHVRIHLASHFGIY